MGNTTHRTTPVKLIADGEGFVSLEHAIALKRMRFNEPCVAIYDNSHKVLAAEELVVQLSGNPSEFSVRLWMNPTAFVFNTDFAKDSRKEDCTAPTLHQAFCWLVPKVHSLFDLDDTLSQLADVQNYVDGKINAILLVAVTDIIHCLEAWKRLDPSNR